MTAFTPPRRENRILLAVRSRRKALGFHLIVPMVPAIEMLCGVGFDFVYLDAEHGSFDLHDVEEACRAAEAADITVVARVPHADPVLISRYLDLGVQGIVVPHVSTVEDAREAVAACFYPPKGSRPFAAARITRYRTQLGDLDDYMAFANANTTLSVQIEDKTAVSNLAAITAIEGIDYFTIGKNDLALSYRFKRQPTGFAPELERIVADIAHTLATHGLPTKDDWMTLGRVRDFIVEGGLRFVQAHGPIDRAGT